MLLDIATATRRNTRIWKNKKVEWSQLVDKLKETHRTHETYAQYMAFPKQKQDEIKDVGGFVGGYINKGIRKPENIKHRQIITLDIDYGTATNWEDFVFLYDCETVVYSTHKHSPDNVRLRFVIPLDRPVNPEEYEAISRRIAGDIGINCFDNTGFQPWRFMYWPSSSSDAEFFFRHQEGEFLNADTVLDMYEDWRDVSAWPFPDNSNAEIKKNVGKQGDPTEKKGLVGAFCRAYPILSAIEAYLPDTYEEAGEDRLTFVGGSTFGGVVLYNDGYFLYSHHNTDPCANLLVNSFDLVRIHKFGHLDKDTDQPITKRESFKEMCELIKGNPKVIREIGVFDDPVPEELENEEWLSKLSVTKEGMYEATINNLALIIANDEQLKHRIKYNGFENNIFVLENVPWCKVPEPRPFVDSDDAGLRHYIERVYKIFHTSKTFDAVNIVALENTYHPIREMITKQKWDGVERLENVLIDYMGAEDTSYVKSVTRKCLIAAVARIFKPGIKYDHVLVLVGKQGIRKSTFFNVLAMNWFSDSFTTVQGKEAYEQLQGSWILEMAELSGIKKAEVETVKHFISKQKDKFRVAYGRRVEEFPRQCIFVGSTNEDRFLKDHTGNRRFWPVKVVGPSICKLTLEEMPVGQIWAEAKYYFDQGEPLYLNEKGILEMAVEMQKGHFDVDERAGLIERYLDLKLPAAWSKMSKYERRAWLASPEDQEGVYRRDYVCVAEIWVELLGKEFGDMNTANTKFIHQILSNLVGWEKHPVNRTFPIYGRQRTYSRVGIREEVEDFI